MNKLTLWNTRAITNKEIEINYLIFKENPEVLALCETWLKDKDKFKIPNYQIVRKDRKNQIGGGLAFCIKNSIQYKEIKLNDNQESKFETQAIKIPFNNRWLNILLIYNPCNNISKEEIEPYANQLDEPKLIMGDLNAHHPFWEPNLNSKLTNKTGKNVFDFLTNNSEILLTPPGQITRIDPKTGKTSTIDLIKGSPNLSHLEITVGSHLNSDHLPIIVKNNNQNSHSNKERKWHFTKEGWTKYKKELNKFKVENTISLPTIANVLKEMGKKCFKFENNVTKTKPNKPWWNENCHKEKKQSF
ncbi:uncharacterized protein LOC125045869 [Penaeus chinensis]|uniref:uncharacterized protein LOC125045869 n=1 Tax=Penaeus chinensis TaxID=139456 RepID=UPI001FB6A1C5|nr:uncharacterized protein LOC125045869 [Penaeus chinensis]